MPQRCQAILARKIKYVVIDHSHLLFARLARVGREPIPVALSRCACVPRRAVPSCPLAIPFDQPNTWKKRVRLSCCLLPIHYAHAYRSPPDLPPPPDPRTGSAIAKTTVADAAVRCCRWSSGRASRSSTRLCGCYGYRVGLDASICVVACYRAVAISYTVRSLGNAFCAFLFTAAPTVRLPYRDEQCLVDRSLPTLKHVHFAAVCRASCNALSFVCLKGESMRIRATSLRCRLLSDCPQTQRLNALIGAELPANPMDIACPWSSSWLTVLLI
jgi:hypothetical protein